ncbi:DUF819 family protein [Myxococcota bacterium]|nr:DUF819 family protein [Myxococcota bacterium]MBU1537381.1 DUF819 family protein [Myxococcota bacterium]
MTPLINEPAGLLALLCGVTALFFFLERTIKGAFFKWLPAYIFVYLVPMLLTTSGVSPSRSQVYDGFDTLVLPLVLTLLLITVPLKSVMRDFSRGAAVMLLGSLGVVVGGVVAFLVFSPFLEGSSWKAFGALAGSWTGGTANMAAAASALEISPAWYGMAILADSLLFTLWLPVLLYTRRWAPEKSSPPQDALPGTPTGEPLPGPASLTHHTDLLILLATGFLVPFLASQLARLIPTGSVVITPSSLRILLVTTISLALSFTPLSRVRGSQPLAMALLYLFVASMGARADLSHLAGSAFLFLGAATLWLLIHGAFVFVGARLLKTDVTAGAIGSAANIGGVASAILVAGHHDPRRVPGAVLLALLGFSIGNYLALVTAHLCRMLS